MLPTTPRIMITGKNTPSNQNSILVFMPDISSKMPVSMIPLDFIKIMANVTLLFLPLVVINYNHKF